MNTYTLLSETVAFETPFFSILDRHYKLPDGSEHHFFVHQEVDTCCVLAQTEDKQFIAVKEFRVGPQKIMTELPAGRLDDFKGDPDQQIEQELLQETGHTGTFTKVGVLPTSPYSTRSIHCYYAINCKKVAEQELDETEFIDIELLSPEEMRTVLVKGKSSSCSPGLLAWEHMKKDGHL